MLPALLLSQSCAVAVAAAVEALSRLQHQETQTKIRKLMEKERESVETLVIPHSAKYMSSNDIER